MTKAIALVIHGFGSVAQRERSSTVEQPSYTRPVLGLPPHSNFRSVAQWQSAKLIPWWFLVRVQADRQLSVGVKIQALALALIVGVKIKAHPFLVACLGNLLLKYFNFDTLKRIVVTNNNNDRIKRKFFRRYG